MSNFLPAAFIIIAAIAPIYAAILYRKYINEKVSHKETQRRESKLGVPTIISAGALFFGFLGYETILPRIKSWFFSGYFTTREVLEEPDEGAPYYDTKEFFVFSPEPDTIALGAFTFILMFWFVGTFVMCAYFYSQYHRANKGEVDYELEKKATIYLAGLKTAMGIALALCLLPMPYSYYLFIRWAILIGGAYLLIEPYKQQNFTAYIFLVCMMILFNPIVPIHFTRLLWNSIDIIFAVILFASAIKSYIDSRDMYA